MQKRKNFIFKNEPFTCQNCQTENDLVQGEIRDHCKKCLCSKHVDKELPGDRDSNCGGTMRPQTVFYNSKKGYMISFLCDDCGKEIVNKTASDDDFDLICLLSTKGYEAK
jgi:hypothetical protein